MRARTLAALMVALLVAWPLAAQEQRGSIEGVVKDSSGAVLPGVAVEARTNSGVVLTTTTNTEGVYRFPSVSPGTYDLTATLQGFSPKKQGSVLVGLGQIKKVDIALGLQGVTESVEVAAESPLVDVKQSARQTNIAREQIELLPKGRDFTSLVTQAPGANNESKLGGISIDGASGGENRYIIDGIETTNLQSGTSGKNVIADFVEEIQVKSSGYTAEFGGATGGVINVLMKSGSNDWRGNALFNWEGDKLQGESRPTLRLKLADTTQSEYITYPKDSRSRMEPGFSLGGPIMRNRAWFFGAYQPALTTFERSVSPTSSGNPAGIAQTRKQKETVQYVTANLTSQLSDSLRGRVAYNNSWSKTDGLLPGLAATDATTLNFAKATTRPNYSVSGHLDWVASPNLFFGIRGGHYFSDVFDTNVPEEPLIRWRTTNNVGLAGVPADLQRPTGFRSITSNSKSIRDQQTRTYAQADGTVYAKLGGDHQVKFGVQADRIGNNVLNGESNNVVSLFWDLSYGAGLRGPFGYYTVRSNGAEPKTGFVTQGDIHTTNIGLFLQDAWTINSKLTINAGVRTEREKVPAYAIGADIPEFALDFGFADKLAPRVGFAYDINGDGRWKAFGSWGVFYDIFKLELPRGSFGGDKWYDYIYTLDTPNWPTLVDSPNCPPACPGTNITGGVGFIDYRKPSFGADAIEPDLKPMKQQEATFGLEHQLSAVVALGLRYVHKQVDRAVEDTGFIDADGHEGYVIANPGEGITSLAFPGVALPKAKRDYDSVEFSLEKRFASNWYLRSSYLWSRLYGNYSGLSQSDEDGRTSPNIGRLFDHPTMMFGQDGRPVFGPLATDRPHQFKTQFIYQFPMGTSVGLNQFLASGLPVSREIGVITGHAYPLQYLGRLSDGRTPMFWQTDMLLQHQFRIGGNRALGLSFNVLNLFNQDTVTSKHSTQQRNGALNITEAGLYAGTLNFDQLAKAQAPSGISLDPRFLQANGFQAPLQARVGVRFSF